MGQHSAGWLGRLVEEKQLGSEKDSSPLRTRQSQRIMELSGITEGSGLLPSSLPGISPDRVNSNIPSQ